MRWVYDDGGRAAAGFKGALAICVTRAIAIETGLPTMRSYDALNQEATRKRPPLRLSGKRRPRSSARTGVYPR